MALGRWQATIQDGEGNVVPSAWIEVRREIAGAPLASLFSDREGATPIGNPFQADSEGFAAFHTLGGAFKIRAYSGSFEHTDRYVPVGTNAEGDFGSAFLPKGAWSGATTYVIGEMVSHVDGGEPYAFVSNVDDNLNHEPQFSDDVGESDAYWTVLSLIEAPGSPGEPGSSDVKATSTTSLAIGTGNKAFTIVESDRGWAVGARLRASSAASPAANWMEGVVTAYADNDLTLAVDLVGGSGTLADWNINLAGQHGAATVTIGTVTTVSPESPATVTNVGSPTAAVLDFEIPQGDPGEVEGALMATENLGDVEDPVASRENLLIVVIDETGYGALSPPDADTIYFVVADGS